MLPSSWIRFFKTQLERRVSGEQLDRMGLEMARENRSKTARRDEDLERVTPDETKNVDNIIINVISGNVYVATGQSTLPATTIQQHSIAVGNWEQLERVLHTAGLEQAELDELSKAINEDQNIGEKVMAWVTKNAPKVFSGGVKIGATVAQNLLIEYLKQYLGIG